MNDEDTVNIAECLIMTPFGCPVVPLVYKMYSSDSPDGNQSSSLSITGSSKGTQGI